MRPRVSHISEARCEGLAPLEGVDMPLGGQPWTTLRVCPPPAHRRLDNPSGYPHAHTTTTTISLRGKGKKRNAKPTYSRLLTLLRQRDISNELSHVTFLKSFDTYSDREDLCHRHMDILQKFFIDS